MKRAYLANGTTSGIAKTTDKYIGVDAATWSYLSGLLGTDYCYLVLGGIEVVKVMGVFTGNALLVQRGIDSTEIGVWPSGTSIGYGLTQAEINDATSFVGYSLVGVNGITVGATISYADFTLEGVGGAAVEGAGSNWIIEDSTELGCVSIAGEQPYPLPLTWQQLRIEEGFDANGYRINDDGSYRAWT